MKLKPRNTVDFNPENPAHVACIKRTLESGRLDPEFRFSLCNEGDIDNPEAPTFTSVIAKAMYDMSQKWMNDMAKKTETFQIAKTTSVADVNSNVRRLPVSAGEDPQRKLH